MTDTLLTIALSKGRIFEETLPLLVAAGIVPAEEPEKSRKLIIGTNHDNIRLVIVRATDVPTYVQYGAADFGIAGKDVLIEHGGDGLYQPLDLHIASCRMMVAVKKGFDYAAASKPGSRLRMPPNIPTSPPNTLLTRVCMWTSSNCTARWSLRRLVGLSDAIVDLVSTGNTLKANGLEAVEHVVDISSRLVVNKAALKTKHALLEPIIQAFGSAAKAG